MNLFIALIRPQSRPFMRQASAYEKQGHVTITRLSSKFKDYRCMKSRMSPPSRRKVACNDYSF